MDAAFGITRTLGVISNREHTWDDRNGYFVLTINSWNDVDYSRIKLNRFAWKLHKSLDRRLWKEIKFRKIYNLKCEKKKSMKFSRPIATRVVLTMTCIGRDTTRIRLRRIAPYYWFVRRRRWSIKRSDSRQLALPCGLPSRYTV